MRDNTSSSTRRFCAASVEAYFDMGGWYLESRIDTTGTVNSCLRWTVPVCGLISILDAMNTGDNDRFHLETLHHSKQEIRRILERGGKIDRTVEYAVDDEDEEYEQYHGFLCGCNDEPFQSSDSYFRKSVVVVCVAKENESKEVKYMAKRRPAGDGMVRSATMAAGKAASSIGHGKTASRCSVMCMPRRKGPAGQSCTRTSSATAMWS